MTQGSQLAEMTKHADRACKVLKIMKELGVDQYKLVLRDNNNNPLGGIFFTLGMETTQPVSDLCDELESKNEDQI